MVLDVMQQKALDGVRVREYRRMGNKSFANAMKRLSITLERLEMPNLHAERLYSRHRYKVAIFKPRFPIDFAHMCSYPGFGATSGTLGYSQILN